MKLSREDMMQAVTEGVRQAIVDLGSDHGRLDVPHEIVHDAIRRGTADAMWRLACDATDMPVSDFYEAIRQGVEQGVRRPGDD